MRNITQRRASLLLLVIQVVASVAIFAGRVAASSLDNPASLGAGALVLIFSTLLFAYWRGWEYARHGTVIVITVLFGVAIPEPFVTTYAPFVIVIPPVLALILTDPAWVIGSAVGVLAILLVRAGGQGVYAEIETLLLYAMAIGGLVLSRLMLTGQQRQLEENEEKYRTLVEHSQQAIIIHQENRIVFANSAAGETFGYTIPELMSLSPTAVDELIHPADRQLVRQRIQDRLAGRPAPTRYEVRAIRKDGTTCWLDLSSTVIEYEGQPAIQTLAIDITERKQAEETLQQHTARLQLLREIDQAILAAQSPADIAQAALSRLRPLIAWQRASVLTFDFEAGIGTRIQVQANGETQLDTGSQFGLDTFWMAETLHAGDVHIVHDLETVAEPSRIDRALLAEGLRSYVNVPLTTPDGLIGSVNLAFDEPDNFNEEQIQTVDDVADQLAIAIQQARLHKQVQDHAADLEARVRERTAELRRLVNAMAGRENRMAELKDVIQQLRQQLQEAGLEPVADDPLLEDPLPDTDDMSEGRDL